MGTAGKTCEVKTTMPILYPDPMHDSIYVKLAQELLIYRGYTPKYGADGYFGPATQSALERFQKNSGLTVSSKVDAPTWAKLLGV